MNVFPYHISQDIPVNVEQWGTMDCGIGHGHNNISKACHCTCPSWTLALEVWYPLLKELVLLSKDKKTAVLSRKCVHCMVGQLTNDNGRRSLLAVKVAITKEDSRSNLYASLQCAPPCKHHPARLFMAGLVTFIEVTFPHAIISRCLRRAVEHVQHFHLHEVTLTPVLESMFKEQPRPDHPTDGPVL